MKNFTLESMLFNIIINNHCKTIETILKYLSHLILTISSFIQQIFLAYLLSARHRSDIWEYRQSTSDKVLGFFNLTLARGKADSKQTANT